MPLTPRRTRTCEVRLVLLWILGGLTPLAHAAPFSTPGELNVNDQGAATYSLPIQAPPGTAGMQPNLSLQYNSQSGNGLLGMGWSLGGLSVIHRCPATQVQDGFKGGINYDANDRFCIDGQRLIAINGAYGANGTEYRTERESFTRVISYGTGPQYFRAWTKSGQILEYGNTADSAIEAQGKTTVRLWAVNRIEDRVGNYLTLTYTEDNPNGQYYPQRIDYTGNSNTVLTPYNSIQFSYQTRPDITPLYEAGSLIKNTVRLTNVQTYAGTTLVKDYRLTYDQSAATQRSRLTSITECGSGGVCLTPTTFEWGQEINGFTLVTKDWRQPEPDWSGYQLHIADVNGDGKSDLVWSYLGSVNQTHVALSNGNGTFTRLAGWQQPEPHWEGYQTYIADINGDGKSDLVWNYLSNLYNYTSAAVSNGDGTFTLVTKDWRQPEPDWSGYQLHIADVNGDGKSDLVWSYLGSVNQTHVALSNGNGTFTRVAGWQSGPGWGDYKAYIADINGDGKSDLVWSYLAHVNATHGALSNGDGTFTRIDGWVQPEPNWAGYQTYIADINGDGKSDLVWNYLSNLYNYTSAAVSNGDGTFTLVTKDWRQPEPDWSGYQLHIADVNGDGKSDLVWNYLGSVNQTHVALSNGNGTFTRLAGWQQPEPHWEGYQTYIADINGDGKSDLVWSYLSSQHNYISAAVSNGDQPLLIRIVNGLGITTTLTYKPITDTTVYTKDSTAAYPQLDIQAPLYVVSSVSTSDGVGGTRSMSYTYGGAKSQLDGRGFLGFRWKQSVDQSTGLKSTTWFNQNFPYSGLPSVTEKRSASGMLLGRSENTWGSFTPTGVTAGSPVMFPALTQSRELSYDLASGGTVQGALLATVTRDTQYDANGNPITLQATTQEGVNTWTTLTTNTYSDTVSTWLLGRITRATVTSTLPNGASATRGSSFSYDLTTGLLTQEVIEPDSATLKLTTDTLYDLFGNKVSVTVSGPDIVSRTSSTTYDAQGRFPVRSTNALGHSEARVFDPRFGAVTSLTGPNSLATTWSYDSFGRKLTETRADATTSTTSYTLCGGGVTCPGVGNSSASYFITTSSTGSAPVTTYFDPLNREIRSTTSGFDGAPVYKDTLYDSLGRVAQTSKPYRSGSPQYASVTYDLLNRPLTQTAYDGSSTSLSYSGYTTSSTNALNQINTRVQNSQGQLINSTDAQNGAIAYSYDPFGNLTQTVDSAAHVTTLSYDLRGRKTAMNDPDMGHWEYTYNVMGELISQKDAKGQISTMAYDKLGRMVSRNEPEGTSTWAYDSAALGIGKLAFVTAPNGYLRTHSYDVFGRPSNISTTLAGTRYYVDTGYDSAGRLQTVLYHTGFAVRYNYTAQGYLSDVRNSVSNALYWQAQAEDAEGRVTQALLGNGLTTLKGYDLIGRTTSISTGVGAGSSVQFLSYTYDRLGNLTQRSDANQNLTETFAYDSLNRLTGNTVSGVGTLSYQYDSLGNLTTKSDVGTYLYGSPGIAPGQLGYAGPHAVTAITPVAGGGAGGSYSYDLNGNQISGGGRSLSYTSYNLPSVIQQGSETQSFQYDPERVRTIQTTTSGTTVYLNPRLDLGPAHYEEEMRGSLIIRKHYINAGSETVALYTEKSDGTSQTSYLHHDHLGSLDTVTNEAGQIIERLAYDAWGKRRQPNGSPDPQNLLRGLTTTRGFTNHEHLDSVGLIHMNGRVYDPALGRFLSPDPHIQAPQTLQSYNRYSYVMNNPLSYTDPSGYFSLRRLFSSNVVRAVVAIAAAYVTAGVVTTAYYASASAAAASAGTLTTITGTAIANTALTLGGIAGGFVGGAITGGDLKSAVNGAVSAGIFAGVNGVVSDWNPFGRIAAKTVTGGALTQTQGGNFSDGFRASFFTATSSEAYRYVTTYTPDPLPGKQLPSGDGTYREGLKTVPRGYAVFGNNDPVTGNFFDDVAKQGGFLGKLANAIPIANSGAAFHDSLFVREIFGLTKSAWTNIPTMLPAGIITIGANLDGPLTVQLSTR